MNAHKPEMTFLSQVGEKKTLTWKVKIINEDKIALTGLTDSNKGQLLIYNRLRSFPE